MKNDALHRKVRSRMFLYGVTNQQIAEEVTPPVTENYVTYVITGRRKGYRIRAAIAEACDTTVEELFSIDDSELSKAA
jgi:hypothetical protein